MQSEALRTGPVLLPNLHLLQGAPQVNPVSLFFGCFCCCINSIWPISNFGYNLFFGSTTFMEFKLSFWISQSWRYHWIPFLKKLALWSSLILNVD